MDDTGTHEIDVDDDTKSSESTASDLGSKLDRTVFSEYETGELSSLGRRHNLEFEAHLILFAHPEDRMLGTRFRLLPHSSLEIGRSSTADISMPGIRSLSRRHVRLEHLGPVVRIEDLGSTNGTYVNEHRLSAAQRLRSGDRFQAGALHFKFLHEADPENAYHDAIYQLVICDGLTRIYNKRKFDEELEREFERAKRHGRPLTLVFFDIDHFKVLNDTYGHLCGDYVLQQIARRAEPFLRPEQTFARTGGEEFVVLCPETDAGGGESLAEKLRQDFADATLTYEGIDLGVTCSFGVAELDESMDRPADLYARADQAMYRAKRNGRDRVTVYR
ncbi:MAG: GGDEF domain-containing protein [Acidobacteriota bacterium]